MDARKAYDARRKQLPWRRWYTTQRWQDVRAAQLRREPMCYLCKRRGVDRVATVANHVVPHHGDAALFWYGTLSSLCQPCHDSDMQRMERGGKGRAMVDRDGWPIDM